MDAFPIADRARAIDASGIRKVFELASKVADPINLSIGQVDFDIPEPIKAAAHAAIDAGKNRYTLTQGIPELNAAILEDLKERWRYPGEHTLITSGVSGGLVLAFLACFNPMDEILVPDPCFVMYRHLPRLAGAVPVYVDTYPNFQLRQERLEAALTPKTKAVIVNSPANPTGRVLSDEEMAMVATFAKQHNLLVISDEIYDAFSYDAPFTSMLKYAPDCLLLGGFSKTYGMTGWRLGFAAGPGPIINEMAKLQQYTFVCAPSIAQYAGLAAMKMDMSEQVADYKHKRDMIYEGLKDRFEIHKPGGAFYLFPKVPWGTGAAFVEAAISRGVLIIPGNVFSEQDTHFRISYSANEATIKKGVDILRDLAEHED